MIIQSMHVGSMIRYMFHDAVSISDRSGGQKSMSFKYFKSLTIFEQFNCSSALNQTPEASFLMTSMQCMNLVHQFDGGRKYFTGIKCAHQMIRPSSFEHSEIQNRPIPPLKKLIDSICQVVIVNILKEVHNEFVKQRTLEACMLVLPLL